jgi:LPPG:FO 2-phospho-L-lactate transferase
LITVLAGGTGSVKLVRGLARVSKEVNVICNVGDNIWLYGLYVCPDIDTITYGLAGVLDQKRGWGIKGDTFSFLDRAKKLGLQAWFGLGDRDLATHLYRTEMLRRKKSLTEITGSLARALGVRSNILPATDDSVETFVSTPRRQMHLQEFWVRHGARLPVTCITFRGAGRAKPTRKVVDAIRNSDRIIIAPANPVSSIGPMLAMVCVRRELGRARKNVVAVSPIIGNKPVSGPAAKYMKALGLEVSPAGVAEYYKDIAGTLVIANADRDMSGGIERLDMKVLATDIVMAGPAGETRLARYLTGKVLD